MKVLRRTQFGNPVLRQQTRLLESEEILSPEIQDLIANMQHTLITKKYGVGLAAPQVGKSIALALVEIQPTTARPDVAPQSMILINPVITQTFGRRKQLWEGCISLGGSKDGVFAKVPRYTRIRLRYQDATGAVHEQDFDGLVAHVIQHEVDHLQGTLFVDRVTDPTTFVTLSEYKKRYRESVNRK